MSARRITSVWLAMLVLAGGCSSSGAISDADAARVRVVNDANLVSGCRVLGTVADNDFQDLQKKAARLGGNVALMTPQRTAKGGYFGLQDYMTADVYRCDNAK
ncbi:MAG TPA: hypothetical protein VK878_09725 [Candidatus Deferrimicrobiaceae bacterium]|nr:hypothetical protein [Candidatus Deferrimicrobiaceae bacterium]